MQFDDAVFRAHERGLKVALLAAPEKQARRIRAACDRFTQEADPERQRDLQLDIIRACLEGLRLSPLRNSPECREAKKALNLVSKFLEVGREMRNFKEVDPRSN